MLRQLLLGSFPEVITPRNCAPTLAGLEVFAHRIPAFLLPAWLKSSSPDFRTLSSFILPCSIYTSLAE